MIQNDSTVIPARFQYALRYASLRGKNESNRDLYHEICAILTTLVCILKQDIIFTNYSGIVQNYSSEYNEHTNTRF